ncbi:hemolysin family protein [Brevibacillus choshinensis]|uniref:HlyC/CorC family transporter n=1 Tax=Brevibacillus choshinensis TaxID=54911 RepID=A0ABX7FJR3_BRECH|nr:hemolysin family protein [Brevibacillus choshinensis]QRG65879.1 HlyC/CorC family transporter [Brevibacillus choshinensis]
MYIEIIVLLLLIVLNAFFAASEIALISLNDNKMKSMAESGHRKAKLLHNLLSEPSRFLATIQIGITLAGFLASAFAAERFAGELSAVLATAGIPLPQNILETISLFAITLILSYFTLVLGELVPKRVAMQKAESIAMFAAVPLTLLSKITAPFVKFLTLSTNVLVRMMGIDPNANKEQVTEEEIRMMVDIGEENGAIDEDEKMMINNIFEFDDKAVSDILTHRTQVVFVSIHATLREITDLAQLEKYTRFPVYDDEIDNIVGILHTKDLIPYIHSDASEFDLKKMLHKPYFVPASKRIDVLFNNLQKEKVHMAIAIDEYGGLAGIVTIEDLLEEIVGNIFDEHDEEDKDFERIDERTLLMKGDLSLRTIQDLLNVSLPLREFDTLSGFMVGQLGAIPDAGERPVIEYDGVVFQAEVVNEKRIVKVRVSLPERLEVGVAE